MADGDNGAEHLIPSMSINVSAQRRGESLERADSEAAIIVGANSEDRRTSRKVAAVVHMGRIAMMRRASTMMSKTTMKRVIMTLRAITSVKRSTSLARPRAPAPPKNAGQRGMA